jgi:hypothetical protein
MSKSRDNNEIGEIYLEMVSGDALGAVMGHGGDLVNTDWYAPGDARTPKVLGMQSRRGKVGKKSKKAKKKPTI